MGAGHPILLLGTGRDQHAPAQDYAARVHVSLGIGQARAGLIAQAAMMISVTRVAEAAKSLGLFP